MVVVSAEEEVDEHEQKGPVHGGAKNQRSVRDSAGRVRELEVDGNQHHQRPDHHLGNLSNGDDDGIEPTGLDAERHECIVEVHGNMDGVVHGGCPNRPR